MTDIYRDNLFSHMNQTGNVYDKSPCNIRYKFVKYILKKLNIQTATLFFRKHYVIYL